MREKECRSAVHDPDCECQKCSNANCIGCHITNTDHITAVSIGKMLGWKPKDIHSKEDKQWLSRACHRTKDAMTNQVLQELHQQRRGRTINLGEHVQIGFTHSSGDD